MALAHVSTTSGTGDSNASTIAATAAAHTAGNLLVAVVCWTHASNTLSSIADTDGNTWTRATGSKIDTGSDNAEIFYAENIGGHATNVVTATFSANVQFRRIVVLEYSGAATSSAFDTSGTGSAASATSATTAALNTAQAAEVLVAGSGNDSGHTYASDAAGTLRIGNVGGDFGAEDLITSSSGSHTMTMTTSLSNGSIWICASAFKEAGGGGGAPAPKKFATQGVG